MPKISETFKNKKALIIYITAGDPSLSATEKLIYEIEKAGADIVELGIPFSDPLADGPIIQASHQRALKKGASASNVLALVKKIRKKSNIPLVLMTSYNLIFHSGKEKFVREAERAGVDGLIVPDLPLEEHSEQSIEHRIDMIYLIAPTSTEERIKLAAEKSTGFIYLISLTGVTGVREKLSETVKESVAKIRKYTDKPIAVGFGISTPAQAREAVQCADGVIVGSAVVDLIGRGKIKAAIKLVASLRKAVDSVS